MSEKVSTEKLTGVPETMLIPLYSRAIETQRPDGIINDEKAVEMMARIDYDFSRFADGNATQTGVAIRTEIFDEQVRAFIAANPDGVIVNLGAGLDTRYFRMDNGRILWYELDLPESIEIREKFISPDARHRYIAKSVLDFSWLDDIEQRPAALFIAEGLLMYFDEADVKMLILTLANRFSGAEMLLEVMGFSQARRTHLNDMVSKTSAVFKWGLRNTADIVAWDNRIAHLGDVSMYDRYAERWLALDLNWPASLSDLRNTVNRIVHLKFGI